MLTLTALVAAGDARDAGGDRALTIILAAAISGITAVLAAYLTARSSAKSNQVVAETTTRGDIETEASQRTAKLYNDLIDRLTAEINDLSADVRTLKVDAAATQTSLANMKTQVTHYRRVGRRLARAVYGMRQQLEALDITLPADPDLDDAVLEFIGSDPA